MSRHLKNLALALVAASAMSAAVASSASATAFKFKSEAASTVLTGSQHAGNDVLKIDGGTVSCDEATYSGSQTGTETTEVEVTPSYSNCTAFGFMNVPIDMNGCKYKFTTGTKEGTSFEGLFHISCVEKPIEITAPGCTVTIGGHKPTGGTITYTNVGAGTTREITVDIALTGVHYTEDENGGGCVGPTGTTKTNGTFQGSAIFTGETSKTVHLGIWVG